MENQTHLTPAEIEQYREQFKDYPQALDALDLEEQSYQQWLDETHQKVAMGLKQLERGEKVDGEIVMAQFEEKFKQMRMEKLSEEI